jgi:hypothetical protein
MNEPDICVVHLVRARNGTAPLQRFLNSYGRHRAGIDHDLLFVLKGFKAGKVGDDFDFLLNRFPHSRMAVADWGFDITTYFQAVKGHAHPFFCFLNSFSEIMADNWLVKLHRAALLPRAGVVGATGSYQGYHEDRSTMPNVGSFPIRARWKQIALKWPYVEKLSYLRLRILYPFFPNPHVRTNAFMIRREVMMTLSPKVTLTKTQAYGFESGKRSMTRQIVDSGKTALVVGRDGTVHDIPQWRDSNTFWRGSQENLLIADNQTRRFLASDAGSQRVFTWYAWGAEKAGGRRTGLESPAGTSVAEGTSERQA